MATENKNYYLIAIQAGDIEPLIKALAAEDMRSIGNEVAWLVRKEYYARRLRTLEELNTHAAKADKTA